MRPCRAVLGHVGDHRRHRCGAQGGARGAARGATQIKLFASGGVVFPAEGHATRYEFTEAELRAAVEEAAARGTYVMAHVYTDEGVRRCLEAGVRSIEHANFVSEQTVVMMAEHRAFYVPTFISLVQRVESAAHEHLPPIIVANLKRTIERGRQVYGWARKHKVPIGFGTDLWGPEAQKSQLREFEMRRDLDTPADIVRSATAVNAELLMEKGMLGVIAEGAHADLLVVEGNPLADLGVLLDPQKNLKLIMKAGDGLQERAGRLTCREGASGPLPQDGLARHQRRRALRMMGDVREAEPVVLRPGPHRAHRRREMRIGEGADRDAHDVWQALVLPEHGRAAFGTKMKGEPGTAVSLPPVGAALALGGDDPGTREESLGAEQRAGAPLALQAMARRDDAWRTGRANAQLAAGAGSLAFDGFCHAGSLPPIGLTGEAASCRQSPLSFIHRGSTEDWQGDPSCASGRPSRSAR